MKFCTQLIATLFIMVSVQPGLAQINPPQADCVDNAVVPHTTPSEDFEFTTGSPTAVHKKTGLMWQRCPVGYRFSGPSSCLIIGPTGQDRRDLRNWSEALASSTRGTLIGGQSGWRLPNVQELRSIVEYGCYPRINIEVFPNEFSGSVGGSDDFWSSTPSTNVRPSGVLVPTAYTIDFAGLFGADEPTTQTSRKIFVRLVRDTTVDFATTIAPAFEHPRCQNCHAVAATNFSNGGDTNGVGLPDGHPSVTANSSCTGCHTSALQPPGIIDPGWHAAPLGDDFRNLTLAELCVRASRVPGSANSAHQHLTQDRLVLWAFAPKSPSGGSFEAAPPYNVEAWQDAIDLWRDFGRPCP